MDKRLHQKLQQSYKQLTAKAPEKVWDSLQEKLTDIEWEEQLDSKIQESYAVQSTPPPVDVWENIEQALTTTFDQQLDDKIKEGFHQQTPPIAPTILWSAISKELPATKLDEELDDKIKESFRSEPTKAPHKVWLALNRQLNIDRTWDRISTILDKPAVTIDWEVYRWRVIACLLLFLLWCKSCNERRIISMPIAIQNTGNDKSISTHDKRREDTLKKKLKNRIHINDNLDAQKINEVSTNPLTLTQQHTNAVVALATKKPPVHHSAKNPTKNKNQNTIHQKKRVVQQATEDLEAQLPSEASLSKPKKTPNSTAVSKWNTLAKVELQPLVASFATFEEPLLLKEKKWRKKALVPFQKLSAGVFMTLNAAILSNNETKQGFDRNSLVINYFGLATNYGLWARYYIGNKKALVAEYSIQTQQQQTYGVYQKGKFLMKKYVFKYNRIGLAYQLDLWEIPNAPTHKLISQLGVYLGIMNKVQLYHNQVLVHDYLNEYRKYDGGIKLSLGHEFAINRFIIAYGLRSDIGAMNIFKGNYNKSRKDNKTHLIHLGAYLHLGYQF